MFKAVENLRERKGFTLIELLIVIAIIGILAAIAIPAFLGQRAKAKQGALEASARGSITEIQGALDDTLAKKAVVFLSDNNGTQTCYDHTLSADKNTCEKLYPEVTSRSEYITWDDVIAIVITHHNTGKNETDPFTGGPLFDSDPTAEGKVIIDSNGKTNQAKVYARTPAPGSVLVYNSTVTSL